VLVLSRADVEDLLDLGDLVNALADAMADLSANRASMPPRGAASVPELEGMLAAMPAYLPSRQALTTKLVSLFHTTGIGRRTRPSSVVSMPRLAPPSRSWMGPM
jgi:ornithine cyclodeaminase